MHQEARRIVVVGLVARFEREIELRRQDAPARPRHLEVIMPRALRIESRLDRCEAVMPVVADELVSPVAESGIVVVAVLVRMPEIEDGARNRLARSSEDEPFETVQLSLRARFDEVRAFGRA